jgi:predicted DNA-binding transcriptional regulator AlpA
MHGDKLIKDKDVQQLLAVSRTSLWRLRKQGKVVAVKQSGNRVYYRASDITKYMCSLPSAD